MYVRKLDVKGYSFEVFDYSSNTWVSLYYGGRRVVFETEWERDSAIRSVRNCYTVEQLDGLFQVAAS